MPDKPTQATSVFCPRCDNKYSAKIGESYIKLLDRLIYHVREQHPDHDPEWFDTFPDNVKSEPYLRASRSHTP